MKKLSLKPPDRAAALQALWGEQAPADLGPCGGSQWKRFWSVSLGSDGWFCPVAGGFSHQYWCVCDFLGLPYREEVQWVSTFQHFSLAWM